MVREVLMCGGVEEVLVTGEVTESREVLVIGVVTEREVLMIGGVVLFKLSSVGCVHSTDLKTKSPTVVFPVDRN